MPTSQISVSGGVHFDLVKRILRDIQRTGQQPQEVMQQITETVFPMYKVCALLFVSFPLFSHRHFVLSLCISHRVDMGVWTCEYSIGASASA